MVKREVKSITTYRLKNMGKTKQFIKNALSYVKNNFCNKFRHRKFLIFNVNSKLKKS